MSEPKKQVELPALEQGDCPVHGHSICACVEWKRSYGPKEQRERQLLSALTESAAKDAALEAANARIARVEKMRDDHFAEIVRAREIIAGLVKRAESAEAKLTAVEGIIAEKLPYVHDADDESYYPTPIVDALFARIREVIK